MQPVQDQIRPSLAVVGPDVPVRRQAAFRLPRLGLGPSVPQQEPPAALRLLSKVARQVHQIKPTTVERAPTVHQRPEQVFD